MACAVGKSDGISRISLNNFSDIQSWNDRVARAGRGRKLALSFAISIFLAASLFGQSPKRKFRRPAAAQRASALENTQPRMILVPVVVRDPAGRALGNLDQNDFELLSDGRKQIISLFAPTHFLSVYDEASGGTAAAIHAVAPKAQRFLALYFDDIHLNPIDTLRATDEADYYLRTSPNPGLQVGIFTSSGATTLPFTPNLGKVHQALMAIQPHPAAVGAGCPELSDLEAFLIADAHDPVATELAIEAYYRCPEQRRIRRSRTWRGLAADRVRVEAIARRLIPADQSASRKTLANLRKLALAMASLQGPREIVVISPGFLTIGLSSELNDLCSYAARSGTLISAIDAGGYSHARPEPSHADPRPRQRNRIETIDMRREMELDRAAAAVQVLPTLADSTGGVFVPSVSALDYALKKADSIPSNYYILGFWLTASHFDGRHHNIQVLLGPRYRYDSVSARDGYVAPARTQLLRYHAILARKRSARRTPAPLHGERQ